MLSFYGAVVRWGRGGGGRDSLAVLATAAGHWEPVGVTESPPPPSCLSVPFGKVEAVAPERVGNGSSFLIRISWLYDQNKVVFTLPLFKSP